MALFRIGKQKEEKKAPVCCCGGAEAKAEELTSCCGTSVDGICCIQVLGAGCKSCHELYEAATEAVKKLDLAVEVEYITDMEKIMEYGVMHMPALVVNDKVVSMGKVLKTAEVEKILKG